MKLTYEELSAAQRRWVDLVEILRPDIKKKGVISSSEIKEIHEHLLTLREKDDRFTCSLPYWWIKDNSIGRGLYQFPGSAIVESEVYDPDLEKLYIRALKRFGLEPKTPIVFEKSKASEDF